MLLVKQRRAVEIITGEARGQGAGRGMLQVLPAQWLSSTVDRCMLPSFRQGDFGKGLVRGVERACEQICVSSAVSEPHRGLVRPVPRPRGRHRPTGC